MLLCITWLLSPPTKNFLTCTLPSGPRGGPLALCLGVGDTKLFGKPCTQRPCGRVSLGPALSTLVESGAQKRTSGATRGRKSSSSPTLTGTPPPATAAPNTCFKTVEESLLRSHSDSSSHGRTSIRNVISGPAPCFLLEYTVFPVCCYHLSLCAEETQGSEELSSGRAEVIRVPKRHFRVFASFGGPS